MKLGELYLFFPQWQGTGGKEVYFGAKALREGLSVYNFVEAPVGEDGDLKTENKIRGYESILSQLIAAKQIVEDAKPELIFMVGGGCDTEIIPVSYLNSLYKGDLVVAWIDAHGDLNTPESSPSGNFHGMPLRTLLGEGDSQIVDLVEKPLEFSHVRMIGTRDLDEPEREYISGHKTPVLEAENVYIHLDLDVLDPAVFPYVKVQTVGGMTIEELKAKLVEIKQGKNVVGGSVVEYVSGGGLETAKELFKLIVK